jgi:hypothetical protein
VCRRRRCAGGVVWGSWLNTASRAVYASFIIVSLEQLKICLAARSSSSINTCWVERVLYSYSSFARTLGRSCYQFTFFDALTSQVWWFQGQGRSFCLFVFKSEFLCASSDFASPPRGAGSYCLLNSPCFTW